jgi:hypothetical protein
MRELSWIFSFAPEESRFSTSAILSRRKIFAFDGISTARAIQKFNEKIDSFTSM